jgi:pseudaminic acid biosynthesis-associated methylase
MNYETEQEEFWSGEFGTAYIDRNKSEQLLASNISYLNTALKRAGKIASVIEFGANIGMNLQALKVLYPGIVLNGIEINKAAAEALAKNIGAEHVFGGSIYDWPEKTTCDLAFIKGVLIHINPDKLQNVYEKLYNSSNKYIMICEYYNPSPVMIPYRGHENRLFKRDFAGELLDKYSDLRIVDYGFLYHRDENFPQDDLTWFLLRKSGSE